MLTPAEELGLSGLSLASRVRKAFNKIPESELLQLLQRIRVDNPLQTYPRLKEIVQ